MLSAQHGYSIVKTKKKIVIDGVLDDEIWKDVQVMSGFVQQFPEDSTTATVQTEIQLTYDDKFLYFSAKMYNKSSDREYVTPSLRRDYFDGSNDMITLVIDTYQDNTNAFLFSVNPWGVQREGLVSGGFRGLSNSWDNIWYSQAQIHNGYWVAEAAIPFKTIRYKSGSDTWNFNFYRIDSETGERTTLSPIPRNYRITTLAFMTALEWDSPLKKAGPNISLIPYIGGDTKRDFEDDTQMSAKSKINLGGDAKIALTPALNLDLTFNPDFSQVEVDQQVTNLNRFELFFPERRQFFLENADLFSDFGHPFYAKTFFSRRIGIAKDNLTGDVVESRIQYGARISGKLDNNWRIGLLNMQTERNESILLPSINYSVGVVQRKVFARSNVGVMFTNKQSFDQSSRDNAFSADAYNRVLGLEYNIASADNTWIGKWMYQRSWDNERDPDEFAHMGWVARRTRTYEWDWAHTWVGENFNAEMGFVPRRGFFRINPGLGYNFYPSGAINQIKMRVENETFWKYDKTNILHGIKSDHSYQFRNEFSLKNTANFQVTLRQRYTYLFESFDPTNTGGEQLPIGTDYTYNTFEVRYRSDRRKTFGYSVSGSLGQYFNGDRYNIRTNLFLRFQPYAAIRLDINYNRIVMPGPYTSADLFLIGPRFDLTMSKKLFLTSFLQFNTQFQNFNINTRLQWRFKPASDLFIVYTDNYATEDGMGDFAFSKKNRALVLKLSYWLNL